MPSVSISSVEDSSDASSPSADASITESGIAGNAIPMPIPVIVHPTYGTASGTSASVRCTSGSVIGSTISARSSAVSPITSPMPPITTKRVALVRGARRDCHQLPAAHASVMNVSRCPASATLRSRTAVSMSGTNASPAMNAADKRNAAAAAAAIPCRARRVPAGTILVSDGSAIARPTTTSGIVKTERSVRPASTQPAPAASSSGHPSGTGSRALPDIRGSAGNTRTAATARSGIGTMNAYRQPTVPASVEPICGPSSPGRIHIAARSARILARMSLGYVFATVPSDTA
jgi:hypothetical protein